ncbi:hypothetical protein LWI29_029436 [Acer saccharum]|uniref:Uncharacterized protein n=1 Tax=Acer saccharum TaxID=4024 RepID=A0AA39W7A5_ACESA|nr:hypothetical protein LWI29_029436 [Acer saccharum]
MTTSSHQLHIAMFPWLAFGHIIPYLELAKLIAQRGHKITFISTPRNIDRLPKLAEPNINFVKLTLPHQDNLPENAEATSDIPYDKVQYLKKAFDGLQDPLSHFLQISSPDWIIYDFAPHWLPPIATKLGISRVLFFIFPSWAICFLGSSSSAIINGDDQRNKPEHFTVPPKWVPFPTNIAFRFHEAKRNLDYTEVNVSGLSNFVRLGLTISGCDVIATRGCFELESDWLKLLGELHQKPVTPLGLFPPQVNQNDNTTIEWLGEQNRGSVLYVALGSELTLSQEEITELALGSKTMTTSSHRLHIAMFPWLAFGHIIPYLELAKLIAQRGHKITFISTPRNIDRLPKLADPSINFMKLTLPHQDNLPENAEAISDIPTTRFNT